MEFNKQVFLETVHKIAVKYGCEDSKEEDEKNVQNRNSNPS